MMFKLDFIKNTLTAFKNLVQNGLMQKVNILCIENDRVVSQIWLIYVRGVIAANLNVFGIHISIETMVYILITFYALNVSEGT